MLSHFKEMGIHKDDAEDMLDEIINYVNNLPNPIRLYRILVVDNKNDINVNQLGSHYSTNKKDLISSHSYLTGYGEKYFIVTVKAPKELIDINQTIINNILYPNENEVTLKNKGEGVEIVSIRKLTI
jgi:hypothetical protein